MEFVEHKMKVNVRKNGGWRWSLKLRKNGGWRWIKEEDVL